MPLYIIYVEMLRNCADMVRRKEKGWYKKLSEGGHFQLVTGEGGDATNVDDPIKVVQQMFQYGHVTELKIVYTNTNG